MFASYCCACDRRPVRAVGASGPAGYCLNSYMFKHLCLSKSYLYKDSYCLFNSSFQLVVFVARVIGGRSGVSAPPGQPRRPSNAPDGCGERLAEHNMI